MKSIVALLIGMSLLTGCAAAKSDLCASFSKIIVSEEGFRVIPSDELRQIGAHNDTMKDKCR